MPLVFNWGSGAGHTPLISTEQPLLYKFPVLGVQDATRLLGSSFRAEACTLIRKRANETVGFHSNQAAAISNSTCLISSFDYQVWILIGWNEKLFSG